MFDREMFLAGVLFLSVANGYKIIDTSPRCYDNGICTAYGAPGADNSIHTNSEERASRTLINTARMFPYDYINNEYGKYQYGTYGPTTVYDDQGSCGIAADKPYYWYSDANQAARWNSWDCQNCDTSCGHNTCDARCYLFGGDCGFGARCDAFVNRDGAWCSAEGLCGANMCYTSGHCSAIFDNGRHIAGIGFYPGANGYTIVYVNGGPDMDYAIPNGAHFDERIKVNSADYDPDGKHLVFLVQYWNPSKAASKAYVSYKGQLTQMDLLYGNNNNAMFRKKFTIPDECEPYFFQIEATDGTTYRLPEDTRYVYGTAWTKWSWWEPGTGGSTPPACDENHYWQSDSGSWIQNGGADVPSNSDPCTGCSKVDALPNVGDSGAGPSPVKVVTPSPVPAPASCSGGCSLQWTVSYTVSNGASYVEIAYDTWYASLDYVYKHWTSGQDSVSGWYTSSSTTVQVTFYDLNDLEDLKWDLDYGLYKNDVNNRIDSKTDSVSFSIGNILDSTGSQMKSDSDSDDDDDNKTPWWVWFVVILGALFIGKVCGYAFFAWRHRQKSTEGTGTYQQFTDLDT